MISKFPKVVSTLSLCFSGATSLLLLPLHHPDSLVCILFLGCFFAGSFANDVLCILSHTILIPFTSHAWLLKLHTSAYILSLSQTFPSAPSLDYPLLSKSICFLYYLFVCLIIISILQEGINCDCVIHQVCPKCSTVSGI